MENPFGTIAPPPQLSPYIVDCAGGGLIIFLNLILRLVVIAAGFLALLKFIDAGYRFITSDGDPQKLAKGRDKLVFAIVGLVVIVSAFVFAALMGIILFGSATAIISPTITGVGAPCPTP